MAGQPVCNECHQPIFGAYISALGRDWHPDHFKCAGCKEPIGSPSFTLFSDVPYHRSCYLLLVAPRCGYCGKPLTGNYLVDHWGVKFCQEHNGQFPLCCFCGRLVPPQHQGPSARVGDRLRCPLCRTSAIDTIEQARPTFARLVRWVGSEGLSFNDLNLQIELRNDAQIAGILARSESNHALGVTLHTTYTEGGKVARTVVNGVAILRSLPSVLFQGVTIHELGHAWLAVHKVCGLEPWQEEGFCELLAHRFYSQIGTADATYHATCIEKNPSSVYGQGFHRIQSLSVAIGFKRLLDGLITERRMPGLPSKVS